MLKMPQFDFSNAKFLSAETIEYHYGKHHKAYVDNYNKLTEGQKVDLVEVIKTSKGPLFNNAAQAWNHTFYWQCLVPGPAALPESSPLMAAINKQFGSFATFSEKFIASATGVFGSGWTWLGMDKTTGALEIINTGNAEVISFDKYMPLMICDVWEHAYYIQYRNARANYLKEFWAAVNWSFVEKNFTAKDLSVVAKAMA